MKIDITQQELKKGIVLQATNDFTEISIMFSKRLRKFLVVKNGSVIKSSKTFVPCMQEFKTQVKVNYLYKIERVGEYE